ncbi:Uncharacterized protein pSLT049 [Escherichia coli]
MNNDELATRRAQAIAEDRCFSKGRLRDEFRMKPAPGAEPVKWYKNTYGGRFAVYRIADCVPMREKRPLTSKQQLAGQRLSVLSRLNSTSGRMARQAYDWLSLAPLFLDTETTGLDNTAEALEIGLTDAAGQVVFGHCCKVSDEAAFCLIQRPYISKTLLTRRISPRGSP